MENTYIIIVVAAVVVVIAVLLTSYITSLRVKSRMVAKEDFEAQLQQLMAHKENSRQLQTEFDHVKSLYATADNEAKRIKASYDEKAKEFIILNNDHVRRKAEVEAMARDAAKLKQQYDNTTIDLQRLNASYHEVNRHAQHWKTQHEATEKRMAEQQKTMDELSLQLKKEFSLLADMVLSRKAEQFNQQQETKLNDLLNPLKEKLDLFKKEITDKINEENHHRTGLQTEVKLMADLNNKLSQQAENLTKALSSNVKQQGNWGETILETILQYVGLQKDIHYTLQQTSMNAEGQIIRPDCIVRYPDNRFIVIDSKVSLVHYKQFTESNDEEGQLQAKQLMMRSMRQHIDGLSGKRYESIEGVLEYVFMFVPVEGAFITAMQNDHQLWQYAFDKQIIVVSPTLLLSAIKLVQQVWQQDNVNRNAQMIAEKAGQLYDKIHGFVSSFEDVGKKLEQANASFIKADNQLRSGKGNVLRRAHDIKSLGAKTNKQLNQIPENATEGVDEEQDEIAALDL